MKDVIQKELVILDRLCRLFPKIKNLVEISSLYFKAAQRIKRQSLYKIKKKRDKTRNIFNIKKTNGDNRMIIDIKTFVSTNQIELILLQRVEIKEKRGNSNKNQGQKKMYLEKHEKRTAKNDVVKKIKN